MQAKALGEAGDTHVTDVLRRLLHGEKTFVVKRTMKIITNQLEKLMTQKGCDASNMFDEEVEQKEMEFSDDE